jgi:hypothetical protein
VSAWVKAIAIQRAVRKNNLALVVSLLENDHIDTVFGTKIKGIGA